MTNEDQPIQRIRALTTEINDLMQEIHSLRLKLLRYERRPSNTVAYILILIGASSLVFSVVWTSQILAFIGLGLAFWGALLLYARPTRYIHTELLDSTAISAMRALNQIVNRLKSWVIFASSRPTQPIAFDNSSKATAKSRRT